MEEMVQLVGNVGFPILMSIYLTIKIETKIDTLSENIVKLSTVIEKIYSQK